MIAIILYVFVCTIAAWGYYHNETDHLALKIGTVVLALVSGWLLIPFKLGEALFRILYVVNK